MPKYYLTKEDCLAHHGILGMKWGIRRYQNEDGTLTEAGKARRNKILKSSKCAEKETKEAKNIVEKKLKGNYTVANLLFDSVKEHTGPDGKMIKGSEGLRAALEDTVKDLDKNLKISELVNSESLKAGRDYIVNAEKNDLILFKSIEEIDNGGNNRNSNAEKNGYKIDNDLGGDFYTKKYNGISIHINNDDYANSKGESYKKSLVDMAKKVENNFNTYNKSAKNAALKNLSESWLENEQDKENFVKNAKLQSITVNDNHTAMYTYYGKNDGLAGHIVEVEFDVNNNKPMHVSVEG